MAISGSIDSFSVFRHAVSLRGWSFSDRGSIEALELRSVEGRTHRFCPTWLPSQDVANHYGPRAAKCRFDAIVDVGGGANLMCGGSLWAVPKAGAAIEVGRLGLGRASPAGALFDDFLHTLSRMPSPRVLEVGSRARSGITRRELLPPQASYLGCDIMDGPNVDVVCDAHELAASLPGREFDAVMAFSVLEHLLMPWKMIIELNAVLAVGAIGLFTTHQCWPIHDAPWDFWRFSDRSWTALLNHATGFRIIEARMSEPAYIIAEDCHAVTNFGPEPAGFLASNVLFEKVAPTTLQWPVSLPSITKDFYPT